MHTSVKNLRDHLSDYLLIDEIARLHSQLKGVKLKSTMRETVIKSRNQERTHS
jgi:hypothetical protein